MVLVDLYLLFLEVLAEPLRLVYSFTAHGPKRRCVRAVQTLLVLNASVERGHVVQHSVQMVVPEAEHSTAGKSGKVERMTREQATSSRNKAAKNEKKKVTMA